ncbi:transporter substrate-binding domain-containing protein [Aestuariirhabdus sp. Z084]|uniref:substrate-binding periplasmic protein n=1 Tax=Aestuariirhabdus haliotis TaxID=2918751 RepID=UPI00201B3997|nr:transporter substrate-binding domain-containing protein [Aestuariirhabdus haliotis]MCL6414913.1 transporter substrate-binding domain-containing protein [Aestuariirhabdus haliotis]MCL6418845.1 transporter substrate-binding domain-containing protein [Aestuariirhabdus haliotis]
MRNYILILVFLGLPSTLVSAQDYLFAGDRFPLLIEKNESRITGLGVEVTQQVMAQLGLNARFEILPWKRLLHMAREGSVDGVIGVYHTSRREAYMRFVEPPIYVDDVMLFARKDLDFSWKGDFRDLQGKRIAVVRGWSNGEVFDKQSKSLRINELESLDAALRAVGKGHYDLAVGNIRNARTVFERRNLNNVVEAIEPPIATLGVYITLSSRGRLHNHVDAFAQALGQLNDSGELKRLQQAYGLH